MRHIFIEGEPGTGKSTVIQRLLPFLPGPVYGFYTKKEPPQADGLSRVYIHGAGDSRRVYNKQNCIAVCGPEGGEAHTEVFDTAGVWLLSGIPDGALVVMDELGVFESRADGFCIAALDMLNRDVTVIGAVKTINTDFLSAVKRHPGVRLYSITDANRDLLYAGIEYDIKNLL